MADRSIVRLGSAESLWIPANAPGCVWVPSASAGLREGAGPAGFVYPTLRAHFVSLSLSLDLLCRACVGTSPVLSIPGPVCRSRRLCHWTPLSPSLARSHCTTKSAGDVDLMCSYSF